MSNPTRPIPTTGGSLLLIDALKAFASQLIVLHHLAIYGPMSEVIRPLANGLVQWLDVNARMAVQVFLVIGGFLSARTLAHEGVAPTLQPLRAIVRRFLRLAPPLWVAIALAVAAADIARRLSAPDHTPASPTLVQLVANLLMLQDVLGMGALSAGLWYVAIDLQLYSVFVCLLWVARRIGRPQLLPWLIAATALASVLHFNRVSSGDIWAPYFFGAYGLGALAWWSSRVAQGRWLLAAMLGMTVVSLALEWRTRLALAGAVALVLAWGGRMPRWSVPPGLARGVHTLGRTSYALFLIHYPVCLIVNALAARFWPTSTAANLAGLLLAWAGSLLAGRLLYRWVEAPVNAWLGRRSSSAGRPNR